MAHRWWKDYWGEIVENVVLLTFLIAFSLNLSQFVEGRRWCQGVRGGIEETRVFAGDQPCNGEEIRRASARFDARQAAAVLDFAQQLDAEAVLNQPHIISRCYYAMYHAVRAVVLHIRRADFDDHERLPMVLSQILGTQYGEILGKWREVRNQVDYSPYAPADLDTLTQAALDDAAALLMACRNELRNRGMYR